MKLKITEFGNPVLRMRADHVDPDSIASDENSQLIQEMRDVLVKKKLGVGLAAPQVGVSKSIAVIELQDTELRDIDEALSIVLINPELVQVYGRKAQQWEGCISGGSRGKAGLFAKVPRYKKVEVEFYDEYAVKRREVFEGLAAQVVQHEIDHLNGVLFVDRVKDTGSFMTVGEYRKMKKRFLG